ncbi:hypothetical protein RJY19_001120 [Vibrio alginolyticus]|nr:hypothetical protein [Vibrio alginolyticus]
MEYILNFLSAGAGVAVVVFLGKSWLVTRLTESIKQEYKTELAEFQSELSHVLHQRNEAWLVKQKACLDALNLANAILSNYNYPNVKKGDILPQFETTEKARSCINELACTCETSAVLDQLKKIMFESVSPDAIVELRSAVRAELGFGNTAIDIDLEKAFIGKLNCDPKTKKQ